MDGLRDILYGVAITEVVGNTDIHCSSIEQNSREVQAGAVFVAVRGETTDGHHYIKASLEAGASAIVCEELPNTTNPLVCYIRVKDSAIALGVMASNFYDEPSKAIKLVGITGTNGKTTIATLAYQLFSSMGRNTGLLSTIENRICEEVESSTHTTGDAIQINRLLRKMVDAGCTHAFMEVSSHAVHQKRIAGLHFSGGVFTNLSHDHLDYHKSFKEYLKAKKKFFDALPSSAFALTNKDDKNGMVMLQNTNAKISSFALTTTAEFKGKVLETGFDGMLLDIDGKEVHCHLVGRFNASNLLAIYGIARLLGEEELEVLMGISTLNPARGRFEIIKSSTGIIGVVDYAHTPDAVTKVLQTLSEIRSGNETLFAVLGCGGGRDKAKRPLMARAACEWSDRVILTSDNPRDEDPELIIDEMQEAVKLQYSTKLIRQVRRDEAIRTAVMMAEPGDIVLIAGKGHEEYQEVQGKRLPFNDRAELQNAFQSLEK